MMSLAKLGKRHYRMVGSCSTIITLIAKHNILFFMHPISWMVNLVAIIV